MKFLLRNGADATLSDVNGRNALFYACALSLENVLAALLKHSEFDLNGADNDGNTALHVCAMAGDGQVMRKLLDELLKYQLNVSIKNYSFLTPLGVALIQRHKECAEMLYNAGGCPKFSKTFFSSILQSMDTAAQSPDCDFESTPIDLAMQLIQESIEVSKAFSVHGNTYEHQRRHVGSGKSFRIRSQSVPPAPLSDSRDGVVVERKYSMCIPMHKSLMKISLPAISHTTVTLMAQHQEAKASASFPPLKQNGHGVQYPKKACVKEGSMKYAARSFHHWRRFAKQAAPINSATKDHVRSILTEVYPSRKTPSYCHSSEGLVCIDSEWVEKMKKYQSSSPVPCECKEMHIPNPGEPKRRYSFGISRSPSLNSSANYVWPQPHRPSSR